jgi:hypothetical protein
MTATKHGGGGSGGRLAALPPGKGNPQRQAVLILAELLDESGRRMFR